MVIIERERGVFRQQFDNDKTIGEWRNGVAIGYEYNGVPYLINKDKKILYRGSITCNQYVDKIHRTSEGYYLVYDWIDRSAPGKDSEYYMELSYIISEDGKTRTPLSRMKNIRLKGDGIEDNGKKVFVPREMGQGIVEHDNIFYRLDDFSILFEIPKKYVVQSIFEGGYCLLDVPEDNRDFIVTVRNKEVVDWIDVNDVDKLVQMIEKTNTPSLIKYCKLENNAIVNVIRQQQKTIEENESQTKWEHLKKVRLYSDRFYPLQFVNNDAFVTFEEFERGITLSQEELNTLKEIYQIVSIEGAYYTQGKGRKYRIRIRGFETYPDKSFSCLFYKDFVLLCLCDEYSDVNNMYRFYSLKGEYLSDKVYKKLKSTKDYIKVENDTNFDNHCFQYVNGKGNHGIVVIKDGKLYDNPIPESFSNYSIQEHYIKHKDEYYDFFFNKLQLDYIDLHVEEEIKNYLFKMKPDIENYAGGDYMENNRLFCLVYHAIETYMNGKLYLPRPRKLSDIQNELHFRRKNIPNFVQHIQRIEDYVDDMGEPYTLYLFKCRPYAYCDTSGHVVYGFDPNNIEF